ncbi:MAG: DUF1801 domain-containing protein [Alphaproteobacteria bacterium]|nr:DUF1801 domain-containing protein [Alphaproteobacteria bacterium]
MPAPDIDTYIAGFPPDVAARLTAMREAIRETAPGAAEKIGYGIPTFTLKKKNLVHFAGYARHVGFYPGPSGIAAFADELAAFESAKGSVRFPNDQPLPLDLVRRIVAFRVAESG